MQRVHLAVVASFVLILAAVPSALGREVGVRTPKASTSAAQGPITQWGRELPELRTRTSRTYLTEQSTYRAVISQASVNYRDGSGAWQPIDSTLIPSGGGFENRANRYRIDLPATLADAIRISEGSHSLSFALRGATGTARVAGSTATYANALPGVDVEYAVGPDAVDETLILTNASARTSFTFDVAAGAGLTVRQNGRGVAIVDSQGDRVFGLVAPFMVDAAGARSDDVTLSATPSGSGYAVTLAADPAWLADPARRFPVRIDPPTTLSPAVTDCSIKSAPSADSIFCDNSVVPIGVDSRQLRGLFRFDASSIPQQSEVAESHLDLYLGGETKTTPLQLEIHRLTRTTNASATWNKYDGVNAWTAPGGDFDGALAGPTQTVGGTTAVWASWQLTQLTQGWIDGSVANNGVIVKEAAPETTLNELDFTSADAGNANGPRLVVDYNARLGLRRHYGLESFGLSDRMAAYVNIANGNLLVHDSDIHIDGTGLDLDLDRVYNNLSTWNWFLGARWTMSNGTHLNVYPNGSVHLWGDSGEIVPFVKNSDGSFTSPTAMDATLVKNADGTYKLTFNQSDVVYNFDSSGSMTSQKDRNGNTISYTGGGTTITDTRGRVTTLTYVNGLLTQTSDPSARTTRYAYDANNNLITYTNWGGAQTQYAYDTNGNLTQITDPAAHVSKFAFDGSRRVTSVIRVTDPATGTGPTTTFAYVAADAACPAGSVGTTVETDPRSNQTRYCYDRVSRITKVTDALGHVRSSAYTANSDVATSVNGAGQTTTNAYDTKNNQTSSTSPTGMHSDATFNLSGPHPYLPATSTDEQGTQTNYSYDTPGNLTQKSDGATGANPVKFTYNANGTIATATDGKANGNARCTPATVTVCYTYNAKGELTKVSPPAPLGEISYTYDSLSRLKTLTDGKGQVTTYGYDALDRLRTVTYQGGATVTYGYDAGGNVNSVADSSGTATYTHDRLNRITQEAEPSGTTTYTYDLASNLATLADAEGTVTYNYDAVDNVSSLTEPGALQTTFTYDANDNRTQTNYPNGISLVSSYDNSERLTSIIGKKLAAGTVVTSHSYTYLQGANDRALRQTMTVAASTSNPTAYTVGYGYDALNRLTSANGSGTNYAYAYDANGNMTSKTVGGTTTTYTVNAVNELTNAAYAYDANGNQTAGPNIGANPTSFTYNAKDQTSNLTRNGNNENTSYFGQGQAQMVNKAGILYHNDQIGMSIRNGSTTVDAFTRTPDGQPIDQRMRDKTTGTINRYYYLADGLGSVVALVDAAGSTNAVSTYKYDPYGNDAGTTGTVASRFRFAGGYLSTTLGLYKFGERWYVPATQRWTQPDPIEDALAQKGWNRYDYGGGNPANLTDPTGTSAGPPSPGAGTPSKPCTPANDGERLIDHQGNMWICDGAKRRWAWRGRVQPRPARPKQDTCIVRIGGICVVYRQTIIS